MNVLSDKKLWAVFRIFVGLTLAYAGFSKLLEPAINFEASLMRYGVFPPTWLPFLSHVVPWLEWILGCFFILGFRLRLTALGVCFLLLSFLVTLGSSRLFLSAGDSPCGCFGSHGLRLTLQQIFLLDLFNFAVALRTYFMKEMPFTLYSFLVKQTDEKDDKFKPRKGAGDES